jgi:hypothetical protein
MQTSTRLLIGLALTAVALPALAPAASAQEIVVTGTRVKRGAGYYDNSSPAPVLALKRTADFAVQSVTVTGDTRDPDKRREEIYAMVRSAIELAGKSGVQIATGEMVVEPLTLENYRNLTLVKDDDREDTESTSFLIKAPLTGGTDAKAALERLSKFVKSVPSIGRAEMVADEDLSLSVVNPEQYRDQIVALASSNALATAARFGPDYGVQMDGLGNRVQWSRASLTEVFLYLPVSYQVRPKN